MNSNPSATDAPPTSPSRLKNAGLVVVVLSLFAGGINYASNLVFGRMLGPAEFGDLTALLSLAVIASVPAFAAQTRVADRLATYRARGDWTTAAYSLRHNVAHVLVYAFALGGIGLLAAPLIQEVLSLRAIGPAIALAPLLVVTFLTPLALGVLQGLERLILLGAFMVAIAISRLLVGVLWVEGGGGSGGAIAGQALGGALALFAVAWLVRPAHREAPPGAATAGATRRIDSTALSATAAFVAFALLSNLDVVLAKLTLPPEAAGAYGALSTIGKVVLFLPSAIAVVMVPRAARRRELGDSASNELRLAALATVVISGVASLAAALDSTAMLRLMFGDQYLDAADGVLPMVLAGTGLSLLYLLVVYTVAMQDRRWSWLLLVGVAAQLIVLPFCDSPAEIASAQAIIIWSTLLLNELLFHPLVIAERWAFQNWRARS